MTSVLARGGPVPIQASQVWREQPEYLSSEESRSGSEKRVSRVLVTTSSTPRDHLVTTEAGLK